jgi:ATP-dependent RNA helicase SUPV3L1/SUV3
MSQALVVAELGPTNTGKTHRAMERMLEHDSGMIGLPLRLLAREVYDRVTARVGEERVALMTGEEKRLPRRPVYWVCTVEAMPMDRPVDFLAVDEIQLAAHRERGHVFTDRLLHARGRRETWFLGADTLRPLLQALIPAASFKRSTRLSQLKWRGRKSLKSLPPRSAIVTFSAERVYELAESVRRLHGGVAVVLGALSPRTRNAQVAMYQAGEVQYLVATDAVGMGLNLDLDHVAFAGLSKFDGFEQRALFPDELGQIAGRAGRHLNEGTFGTLNPYPELDPRTISAIEAHRFGAVRSLVWRNGALDFSSPDRLVESLSRPPSHPAFVRVERAEDFDALRALLEDARVRQRLGGREALELLWDVCSVPDFRKGLFGHHVALLREIFLQLSCGGGRLDEAWLNKQVGPLEDVSGDLHALMDRLAAIRIWTYVSSRGRWLNDAEGWQERARRIEDALGDALHARLVERFVERAARKAPRRFLRADAPRAPPPRADSPFAGLSELLALPVDSGAELLTEAQFVDQVVQAPHAAFEVDAHGKVTFEGEPMARLVRGQERRSPQAALAEPDAWTAGARRQLERRLLALARDLVTEAMGGFPGETLSGEGRSAATRGLAFRLADGLGIICRADAEEQWAQLTEEEKSRFRALGATEGGRYFYIADAVSLRALERRALLTSLQEQRALPAGVPREPVLERATVEGWEPWHLGYERLGPVALRFDLVERVARSLADPRLRPRAPALLRDLGLNGAVAAQVLRELGAAQEQRASKRRRRRRRRPRRAGPRSE